MLGVFGIFLNRKNVIIILMSIELILLAVNLNLVAFSAALNDLAGQVMAMFVFTILRTASLIRSGRADLAIRFRQYTSDDGSNPGSSSGAPIATFHRTSNRAASAASRSE